MRDSTTTREPDEIGTGEGAAGRPDTVGSGGQRGAPSTGRYVADLHDADHTQVTRVGGKGANLGELSRIDGVRVPAGFCVTTSAFQRMLTEHPAVDGLIAQLDRLCPDDRTAIREIGADLRRTVESAPVPDDVAAEITHALARLGESAGYAVRSSATAEDLPTASFAGQQDSYLNVVGTAGILHHVRRCFASLFTERAIAYRQRNGIGHRTVRMAVLVQRMLAPDAAGVLFTADPVSGNRTVTSVSATLGLGTALVSGLVDADLFTVRDGEIVSRQIATKRWAVHASPSGGTEQQAVEAGRAQRPALTDEQVVRLARLGRRIEAHFGRPQDIEWCLVGDDLHIVQSRPITTLFPVPAADDGRKRVYLSVGHQQMMTDPMRPLGLSVWQLTALAPMHEAGGRLFVDATAQLTTPAVRAGFLEMIGRTDPLTRDALETVLARGDLDTAGEESGPPGRRWSAAGVPEPVETDPAIVAELVARTEAAVAALRREIRTKQGPELFEFLLAAFEEHRKALGDPLSMRVLAAGMEATWWLNDRLYEWLGERNAADTLSLSAPGNVTSEMGLSLLDVADAIRPYPEVVAFLSRVRDDGFLAELPRLAGGTQARDAIRGYLDRYGMRCVGEIDITRPRWRERPSTLLPVILDHVRTFPPGAARQRFEQGRQQAEARARELLDRLRALPDGDDKADQTRRMIDRLRTFVGYREFPKYGIVCRYLVYRQALLAEAERLTRSGVLTEAEDAYYLTFQEFHQAVRTNRVDGRLIRRRRDEFRAYQQLTPPRVLTSEGEAISGSYRRDGLPDGALAGLAVSAGTAEGRARVVRDLADAHVEPGDILVTAFTDPSWTPLFVAVAGLVTEVGGLMTHGAVIAREYGLPAVVGVAGATRLIRDGQRIRVHGTDGYVEILSDG